MRGKPVIDYFHVALHILNIKCWQIINVTWFLFRCTWIIMPNHSFCFLYLYVTSENKKRTINTMNQTWSRHDCIIVNSTKFKMKQLKAGLCSKNQKLILNPKKVNRRELQVDNYHNWREWNLVRWLDAKRTEIWAVQWSIHTTRLVIT